MGDNKKERNIVNRFIPVIKLLEIIESKHVFFSDYKRWEDENDIALLDIYKRKKKIESLFLLCFTLADETIYHWTAFSDNKNICCVEFDMENLKRKFIDNKNIRFQEVKYLKLNELKTKLCNINDVPFLKRWPYRNEAEFRIIYESMDIEKPFAFDLEPGDITKITISQKIDRENMESIKRIIKKNYEVKDINQSTLYRNQRWINTVNKL